MISFKTGEGHQEAVASWARSRLVDRGGSTFDNGDTYSPSKQAGCLFADGVGLGKTWEALASIAVLLDQKEALSRKKRLKDTKRGRVNLRRKRAHVLIVVPPGLVGKWRGELTSVDGFQARLSNWATEEREFVTQTLAPDHCYTIRNRDDLQYLPSGSQREGFSLPSGTYICNWNLLLDRQGRGRSKLEALRKQEWDVVVVDEAHHKRGRNALAALASVTYRLLLTATPFQLDMTELHGLTKHLLSGSSQAYKVLAKGPVREFAKAADAAFEGASAPPYELRQAAEATLGQLVACSKVGDGKQNRHYFSIDEDGRANQIPSPAKLDKESHLSTVLEHSINASESFQEWYLRMRLGLIKSNSEARQKHIPMELRKAISIAEGAPYQPKTEALRAWARQQFPEDLSATLKDGVPRKVLVFSSLKKDVVAPLCEVLEEELRNAHLSLKSKPEWKQAHKLAGAALSALMDTLRREMPGSGALGRSVQNRLAALEASIKDSLYFDLLGNPDFAARVREELLTLLIGQRQLFARKGDEDPHPDEDLLISYNARINRRSALATLGEIASIRLAATYSGDNTRIERDVVAEAFKMALSPWVLVATNVGSEGIDLHRFSLHLIHFDLEWNPARLEQREGRIDRLGRVLDEPARIYFLLIKDTYDERMMHQLVARQRWHGVLLGRKALQLDRDDTLNARWVSIADAESMSLNLDPRR